MSGIGCESGRAVVVLLSVLHLVTALHLVQRVESSLRGLRLLHLNTSSVRESMLTQEVWLLLLQSGLFICLLICLLISLA